MPPVTPVTNPDVEFNVMFELAVLHIPPVLALLNVIACPTHTGVLPENEPGAIGVAVLQLPTAPVT